MSEEMEHASEETEAEESAENQNNEQSKTEASILNNQPEASMLEDEEMPTYISVSGSSKRDDSDVCNAKRDERLSLEEDNPHSPHCIYVSSAEDSDHIDSNDDVDYGDSDDMDELETEKMRAMRERCALLDDEEEEDDDDIDEENPLRSLPEDDEETDCDEYPSRMSHDEEDDGDDDFDEDYDPKYSDRASDDFILNNRLKPCHKERSLSLQDLDIYKNNVRSPRKRKIFGLNIVRQNYFGVQQPPMICPVTHKKQSMPLRYKHVESKVKRYIEDMKDRGRRSIEKRFKDQQRMHKNHVENENDAEHITPIATNKIIKDYAEKAIKDLELDEDTEDRNLVFNVSRLVENGENNKIDVKPVENKHKHARIEKEVDLYCETVPHEKNSQSRDNRLEKRNGSIDMRYDHHRGTADRNSVFNVTSQPMNGHQPALSNIHSVTYEEYMHGGSNADEKNGLSEQPHAIQEDAEIHDAEIINVPETDNGNASCRLKIESVKSIRMSDETENSNFPKVCQTAKPGSENAEVDNLKVQLNEKTTQYNNLRDTYQKTLSENVSMKLELEALKKSLAKYECEKKSCEMKGVAVQTEILETPVLNQAASTAARDTNNKASASSVASTISSIERWADSECSPAISMKPPDLTAVLNSDDSSMVANGTPTKTVYPISRAFLTSSRILQTLSIITQGKTKAESPLVRNPPKTLNDNSTDQLLNSDYNTSFPASNSKKRKATDMLGTSPIVQPFKIPHTVIEPDRKSHDVSSDVEFNYTHEHTNSKSGTAQNLAGTSRSRSESVTCTENKVEETDDHDDNVKCFVYREDENSKNKSFLIKAEEPSKHTLPGEKGRIQECGPYLLGNLEVRMSEINGTISVWGKEIDLDATTENEDEMETSAKTQNKKTYHSWQNSSQNRFNGTSIVCSTNKKQKIPPKFNGSHIFECSHQSFSSGMKSHFLTDGIGDKNCRGSPCSPNIRVPTCENCDTAKSRDIWQSCKRNSNLQENIHSCCTHHSSDREYNCDSYQERQNSDDSSHRSKDKFNIKEIRRGSYKNTPESNKHLHDHDHSANCTAANNDGCCKHSGSPRCSLQNLVDNCQQHSRSSNTVRNNSCTCKTSAPTNIREYEDRNTCNRSPSNDGDEDPLISYKRSNETPEMRQRRLSGKRVRGILMDLLRGCGDCRNTSVADQSNTKDKDGPYLVNPPQIKISPCNTPEPSCSNRTPCRERCCHDCARRIEMQLEEFRMEMERVRSRSDAILDMLSMLHSVDTN